MRIGQKFKLTANAVENYGEEYRDRVFQVTRAYDHYAPPGSGHPTGHPGFDAGAGKRLYEFKDAITGEDMEFAVYSWEMKDA